MNENERVKNTAGLKAYSAARNKETIKKVNSAIEKLKKSKDKAINFKTVSEEAGVAKATLYNNSSIRERIEGLRSLDSHKVKKDIDKKGFMQTKDADKLHIFMDQNRKLRSDKKKLILQLEELQEIKEENTRLKKRLEILKEIKK